VAGGPDAVVLPDDWRMGVASATIHVFKIHVFNLDEFNCRIIRLDVLGLPQVQSINMALDFSNI
jgi:hypothetical protein